MRILGIELSTAASDGSDEHTLVLLAAEGGVERVERVSGFPAVAAAVGQLVGDEPFLLGVDIPVVVPAKRARTRPVESLVRRRFGTRLPAGGRAAQEGAAHGMPGEALMAGLATAGLPCLPYPDRSRRQSGLVETHPGLVIKSLLWESSSIADNRDPIGREEIFRAYEAPAYRRARLPARSGWPDQVVALELVLRSLGPVEGFDLRPVWSELGGASSDAAAERTAALLDSLLIACTARRYLEAPEACLFLGDQENGYVIVPADGVIRRLALADSRPQAGALFPQASLRERLGGDAKLRSMDLLNVPGRPQRLEASFKREPKYEFDNLDEMLWWKHCRHLAGPRLPVEGLCELIVVLESHSSDAAPLRLVRSRHPVLSFRFDPPTVWRASVPTRDGKTYPFRVLRAVYETLPSRD